MDYIVFLKNGDSTILRGIKCLKRKGDVLYFADYEVPGGLHHICAGFNLNHIAGYRIYNSAKWPEYLIENKKDCDGKVYANSEEDENNSKEEMKTVATSEKAEEYNIVSFKSSIQEGSIENDGPYYAVTMDVKKEFDPDCLSFRITKRFNRAGWERIQKTRKIYLRKDGAYEL